MLVGERGARSEPHPGRDRGDQSRGGRRPHHHVPLGERLGSHRPRCGQQHAGRCGPHRQGTRGIPARAVDAQHRRRRSRPVGAGVLALGGESPEAADEARLDESGTVLAAEGRHGHAAVARRGRQQVERRTRDLRTVHPHVLTTSDVERLRLGGHRPRSGLALRRDRDRRRECGHDRLDGRALHRCEARREVHVMSPRRPHPFVNLELIGLSHGIGEDQAASLDLARPRVGRHDLGTGMLSPRRLDGGSQRLVDGSCGLDAGHDDIRTEVALRHGSDHDGIRSLELLRGPSLGNRQREQGRSDRGLVGHDAAFPRAPRCAARSVRNHRGVRNGGNQNRDTSMTAMSARTIAAAPR